MHYSSRKVFQKRIYSIKTVFCISSRKRHPYFYDRTPGPLRLFGVSSTFFVLLNQNQTLWTLEFTQHKDDLKDDRNTSCAPVLPRMTTVPQPRLAKPCGIMRGQPTSDQASDRVRDLTAALAKLSPPKSMMWSRCRVGRISGARKLL